MRIGYAIGSMTAGGTERQLAVLAAGLSVRGHQVEVMAYDGPGFFDEQVQASGVTVRHGSGGSKMAKVMAIRRWLAEFDPHVAHGLMKRASSLLILSSRGRLRRSIVATDLSTATYGRHKPDLWAALVLFGFADRVVTQTERNRRSIGLLAPWLRTRTVVVRNGVDTERFSPPAEATRHDPFRFLCVGTVYRVKNPLRVVHAARILRDRGLDFRVDWVGHSGQGGRESEEYLDSRALVESSGLEGVVEFLGPSDRTEDVYPGYDALLHVSLQEGIPNAVVEGMACGLPIVVSRVSDLPMIVAQGRNGFVCDEREPGLIADAMRRMIETGEAERREMGARSRDLAVRWFGSERFMDDYEKLYASIIRRSGPLMTRRR